MRYKIIRMYQDDRPSRTIKRGLTLEEAQAHCSREDTHGGHSYAGTAWFDGYDEDN